MILDSAAASASVRCGVSSSPCWPNFSATTLSQSFSNFALPLVWDLADKSSSGGASNRVGVAAISTAGNSAAVPPFAGGGEQLQAPAAPDKLPGFPTPPPAQRPGRFRKAFACLRLDAFLARAPLQGAVLHYGLRISAMLRPVAILALAS